MLSPIPADTKIAMSDGRHGVSIYDLCREKKPARVFSIDRENTIVATMMYDIIQDVDSKIPAIRITFDSGDSFRIGLNGKLLTKGGQFVDVRNLKVGDRLRLYMVNRSDIMNVSNYYQISAIKRAGYADGYKGNILKFNNVGIYVPYKGRKSRYFIVFYK